MSAGIVFSDVWKSYLSGGARPSLRDDLARLFAPARSRTSGSVLWALRGVSFEVAQGRALGVIGLNGAGKSTSLKILARIHHPDRGEIRVRGRVGALINVGAGIHPELSGRENIYLAGSIVGMSRQEIRRRFDEIVTFSELEDFLETPVKHYSSGMQVRLGFAVAAHVDVDVLLIDEVLAVGDAAFQKKCLERVGGLRDRGVAILLVSHQLAYVQTICTETVLLVKGEVAARGPTAEVLHAYNRYLDERWRRRTEQLGSAGRPSPPARDVRIAAVRVLGATDEEQPRFDMGDALTVRVELDANQPVEGIQVSVSVNSTDWNIYTGADTKNAGFVIPRIGRTATIDLCFPELGLGPGVYEVNVGVWDSNLQVPYALKDRAASFIVESRRALFAGRFVLRHEWRWRDGGPE
jgi:lipopolysaccharide transport system ATP-binding protein